MSHRPLDLDVRTVSPADRATRIESAFAELQPGEALIVTADQDPHALLYQLEVDRPGGFNWSPLQEGPRVWRVRIDRRAASHQRHRGVNEYLAWDHDRLDSILDTTEADARSGNWSDAALGFADFRHGLLRHIKLEEELLFPAFEQRSGTGPRQGPTEIMREEHQEIQAILGDLGKIVEHAAQAAPAGLAGLAASDRDSTGAIAEFGGRLRDLVAVLGEHNLKEEHVLYPSLDQLLGEDERDALVRRMMAVRL